MKKISTVATKQIRNFSQPKLTIGLDLGDRSSWYCLLDEVGEVLLEQKLSTTPTWMPIIVEETAVCPEVGMAKAAPAPAVILRNSRRFTSNFNMDYSYFLW